MCLPVSVGSFQYLLTKTNGYLGIWRFMILLNIHLYLLNYRTFVMPVIYSFLMIHLDLKNLSYVAEKFSLINLEEAHDLGAFSFDILFGKIM